MSDGVLFDAVLLVGEIEDHGVCCWHDSSGAGGTIHKLGGRLECGVLKPDGVVISFAESAFSRAEEPEVAHNEGVGSGSTFGGIGSVLGGIAH